jgi:hypothetical protein
MSKQPRPHFDLGISFWILVNFDFGQYHTLVVLGKSNMIIIENSSIVLLNK